MKRKILLVAALVLVAIEILLPRFAFASRTIALTNPCALDPNNLITNGLMAADNPPNIVPGYGEIATSWHPFVLTAFIPVFEHVTNEQIDPNGSQYIWADVGVPGPNPPTFDAGIYQTVTNLNPGTYYHFWLGYALAANDPNTGQNVRVNLIGRQIGYDLTGGTDPKSSNVAWSTVFYNGVPALNIPALGAVVRAQTSSITFFLRAINTMATGRSKVWFDSVCMESVSAPPTPTATQAPPAGTRVFLPLVVQQSSCAPTVLATFDVGGHPKGIATDAATNRVFTALFDASSATFVDASANVAAATWWLNDSGLGNGIGFANGRVFASMHDSSSVSILNASKGAFLANRGVGSLPYGVGAANMRVWVANFGSDSVSVLDAATNNVIATRNTGTGSGPALVAASGNRVFVSLYGSGVADIASDGTLSHTYPLGAGSFGVAFNASTNRLYVSNRNTNQIAVVDPNAGTILNSVTLSQVPFALAINPSTNRLFVVLAEVDRVDVRDGNTLARLALLSVGSQGADGGDGIGVMNGRVYVANNSASTITVMKDTCP